MFDMDNKFSGQWSVVSGRGAEKGFSLIEVLIITAIVGILTTIAVMNFGGIIDSYKVRGAASQLYSEMQMARLKAIKEGKEWAMQFSGNTYSVRNKGVDGTYGNADDVVIKTVDLSSEYSGFSIRSSPTRNIFYPNGTAGYNGASSGTVVMRKGAKILRLKLNTGTGSIRIE